MEEAHSPQAEWPANSNVCGAISGLRVLVAEDNPLNQRLISKLIEKAGHELEMVAHGEEAVCRATEVPRPDVVLMDCQMPVMDGLDATRRIRAYERQHGLEPVPIVALTAHAMEGDRESCLAAGMNEYLSKPLDRHKLYALLMRCGSE